MCNITDEHELKLLTAQEVADIFRVNVKIIGQWVRDGKLETVKYPGKNHRFSKQYILDLLTTLTTEKPSGAVKH